MGVECAGTLTKYTMLFSVGIPTRSTLRRHSTWKLGTDIHTVVLWLHCVILCKYACLWLMAHAAC